MHADLSSASAIPRLIYNFPISPSILRSGEAIQQIQSMGKCPTPSTPAQPQWPSALELGATRQPIHTSSSEQPRRTGFAQRLCIYYSCASKFRNRNFQSKILFTHPTGAIRRDTIPSASAYRTRIRFCVLQAGRAFSGPHYPRASPDAKQPVGQRSAVSNDIRISASGP